jgi:DNA-directed RNA polymerase subunit RPC12/RpoP
VNGYCIDCGEEYELNALNLDLRCADCVEQWVIDDLEKVS